MRRWRLNSGYCGTTDQRRTKAGTIPMLKHNMERNLGVFGNDWTPTQITTSLWLDANDSSTITIATGVSTWADKSGNGKNATQATAANQPTYSSTGFNSKPTIQFDGTNDLFNLASITQTSGQNIFAVVDTTLIGSGYCVLLNRSTTTAPYPPALYLGGTSLNYRPLSYWNADLAVWGAAIQRKAMIRWAHYTTPSALSVVQVDGGTQISQNSVTSVLSTWNAINNSAGQQSRINLSELIMTSADPTSETRQKIEGYLAHKWGLTSSLPNDHPYKSSTPSV
jgi:hypothetical protein